MRMFLHGSVLIAMGVMVEVVTSPQLERHFYLFQPIPKVFPRNHVKSFPKVNKTTKKIGFSIVELLCNDPKGNKMVHS